MNRSVCTLALACCLASGCGRSQAPTADERDDDRPVRSTVETKLVEWDSSLIDGGSMFEDYAAFRAYVRRSSFIAKGRLTRLDRDSTPWQGNVMVEEVLLGDPLLREAPLVFDGGFVTVETGDEVLILLRDVGDTLILNSFCGVSGVTRWTDDIANVVSSALQ